MNQTMKLLRRFRALFRKEKLDAEMSEEMRMHLELQTRENLLRGMSPDEARNAALRSFGGLEQIKEQVREQRGLPLFEQLITDLRFAGRSLRKQPGFTAVAVATLALGIGATAAMFSLMHGVLLSPTPYPRSEQVMLVSRARLDGQQVGNNVTVGHWLALQKASSFAAVAGYDWNFTFLMSADRSDSIQGMSVTPEYFEVTGLQPLLGRAFVAEDSTVPRDKIILGYRLWQERFGGVSDIIGQKVILSRNSVPFTVVGVMPPDVRFLPAPNIASEPNYDLNATVAYWLPAGAVDPAQPLRDYANVVVRRRDGVTADQAQAEIAALATRLAQETPQLEGITLQGKPVDEELNREASRLLLPLFGAVALVFLIACGNVAGLLLARGFRRQQEYVVRCALGAQRRQLFRHALSESLVLALPGALLGVALALALIRSLKLIGGHAIPRLDAVTLGWPTIVFCVLAAIVAAVLAGLAPAWHAARAQTVDGLKGTRTSSAGRTERRFLGSAAVIQTALTLALLVGAGLLIRTVSNLASVRPGYDTTHVLALSVTMPDPAKAERFNRLALERVAALPGVKQAAFGWGVPLTGNNWWSGVKIEGDTAVGNANDESLLPLRSVTPDYFEALGMRIVAGRAFRMSDDNKAPFVAMINETMAQRFFGAQPAIGRKLTFPGRQEGWEIVGVLADTQTGSLLAKPEPEIYLSFWQRPAFSKHMIVRADGDPRALGVAVQREIKSVDPIAAVDQVKTLDDIRADSVAAQTFAMRLLVGFSLVGTVLALVGIYGVLSLSVDSRRREIAIRMALGAPRNTVLGSVLSEGLRLMVVGLAIGGGVAYALARVLEAYLFGVTPTDPLTFTGVALLFVVVALLACYFPARRATRVDPMVALRAE